MMGYLYRPKLRSGEPSSVWWAKYYVNGRAVRESTGTAKETEARRFMKEREGRAAAGQPILPRADRIQYEEIRDDLRRHYTTTGTRDIREADTRLRHLDTFFKRTRVSAITPAVISLYVETRQKQGRPTGPSTRNSRQ